MNCQVCGSVGSLAFIKNNYRILECKSCSFYFTDLKVTPEKVNEIYSDIYFYDGGDGYSDYTLEGEMLVQRGEYYARKISKFISSGKVLDAGAAAGFILKGFENIGWLGVGVEPNTKMVEYGKKVLGLDLRQGTLETVKINTKFDLIVLIQVIAHLFSLDRSIQNASDLLKPGGYVLVETWNRSSLTAKLFGKYWHEYSPPSTLNFFDKKTLDALMSKFSFHKIRSGWPQKKIKSNHAKSLLKHKMEGTRLLRKISGIVGLIPDNVLLPYPAEDLFWALYRKNI
jgi:2-polyprenyl-3-methyl-5-hydroxy-6-metoxy-1,4-benzoquinol methylase